MGVSVSGGEGGYGEGEEVGWADIGAIWNRDDILYVWAKRLSCWVLVFIYD